VAADSENACVFRYDAASDTISGRQRGIVYLIPNPNSREGLEPALPCISVAAPSLPASTLAALVPSLVLPCAA
jgi:hypothetical protein